MSNITVTVSGWAGTNPSQRGDENNPLTVFRLASTPSYFDRNSGEWKDKATEWFDVRTRGAAGDNVAASIKKGEPILVTGRLSTNTWIDDAGTERTTQVIDADSIGHDLTRGTATFTRGTD